MTLKKVYEHLKNDDHTLKLIDCALAKCDLIAARSEGSRRDLERERVQKKTVEKNESNI